MIKRKALWVDLCPNEVNEPAVSRKTGWREAFGRRKPTKPASPSHHTTLPKPEVTRGTIMTSYSLSPSAYHLLCLHATKYTHSITGILLGEKSNDRVELTRVLPVAHSDLSIHTTPLTETALHLCEHYATTQRLCIAGVYFANDVVDDTALPTHAVRIADRIRQRFPDAVVLRIDGVRFKALVTGKEHCLVAYSGEGWKRDSGGVLVEEIALRGLDRVLRVQGVCDFEDHLLDPRADWLNLKVLESLHDALQASQS